MKKRIVYEIKGLYRDNFRVTGFEFGKGKEALCIVGSMRGNEVQQLYCCSLLVKKFKRFWPIDNTDINRMFPGYDQGETTQRIANGVFSQIKDYAYGIQFTSFFMHSDPLTYADTAVAKISVSGTFDKENRV